MKRAILAIAIVISICPMALSQTPRQAGVRTFELTAIAPPKPALTYQLRFDDLTERRPGNAAILYLEAVLLLGPDANDKATKALAAFDAADMKSFDALADALNQPALFEELDLAGRREQCDWQAPYREVGLRTLLPHLEPLLHGVARSVKVRTLRQIELGKVAEALDTLRLGYELSDNVGRNPTVISGLVSLNITTMMNDALAELMSRSDSPNLYWALAGVPSRRTILHHCFDGERMSGALFSVPNLARAKAGEDLSAEQWRAICDYVAHMNAAVSEDGDRKSLDPVKDASPEVLGQARQGYASTRHITAEQAAQVDPAIVLGNFYFWQYQISVDEMYKLRWLAYPQWLSKAREYGAQAEKWIEQQPANPFLHRQPTIERVVWRFASCDRETAALTAVEAIRSYAAANGGKLPEHLDDVTDTPVPTNPATNKPFEYQLQNDAAVLSDPQSPDPLTYTIRIRK